MRNRRIIEWCLMLTLMPALTFAQTQRKGSMKTPFVFSNQFKHSVGAGVTFFNYNKKFANIYNLSYNPSLSLTRSYSDFSISLGTQISGGYHPSIEATDPAFIFVDLPLLAELNFGHNASKDFYTDVGWFFGGGYTYHLFNENWNHGPVATIGLRSFLFGPSFTLRYSRYFTMQDNDESLHTITLLLNMGKYFEQVKLNNKVSRFSNGFRK